MTDPLSAQRYNHLAMLFHWSIALFILFNLSVGFFMEGYPEPLKRQIIPLHISLGMSVFGLALLRLLWRLTHRPPAFSPGLRPWEKRAAHLVHGLLYVLMFALPLTGWAFISAHPLSPFKVPPMMPITMLQDPQQKQVHDLLVEIHAACAWLMIGLLVLHVAAALKHQFLDDHQELQRMGLGRMR
jgi:cytochrome b561